MLFIGTLQILQCPLWHHQQPMPRAVPFLQAATTAGRRTEQTAGEVAEGDGKGGAAEFSAPFVTSQRANPGSIAHMLLKHPSEASFRRFRARCGEMNSFKEQTNLARVSLDRYLFYFIFFACIITNAYHLPARCSFVPTQWSLMLCFPRHCLIYLLRICSESETLLSVCLSYECMHSVH